MEDHESRAARYRQLNAVAGFGGTVLFGSTFAANLPLGELKQAFELEGKLFNRSFADLTLPEAPKLLRECCLGLSPDTLLLQLGETDLARGCPVSQLLFRYEALIAAIRREDRRCRVVLLSVCAEGAEGLNAELAALAKRLGCGYADLSAAANSDAPCVKIFGLLRLFLRDRVTDYDALHHRIC